VNENICKTARIVEEVSEYIEQGYTYTVMSKTSSYSGSPSSEMGLLSGGIGEILTH
jgi:hypothetical protein